MPTAGAGNARRAFPQIDPSSIAHHARREARRPGVDMLPPAGIAPALLFGHSVAGVLPQDEHCTRVQVSPAARGAQPEKTLVYVCVCTRARARWRTHHQEEEIPPATPPSLLVKGIRAVVSDKKDRLLPAADAMKPHGPR